MKLEGRLATIIRIGQVMLWAGTRSITSNMAASEGRIRSRPGWTGYGLGTILDGAKVMYNGRRKPRSLSTRICIGQGTLGARNTIITFSNLIIIVRYIQCRLLPKKYGISVKTGAN